MRKYNGIPKELDDQLEALLAYLGDRELTTLTGVDVEQLRADVQAVRRDRVRYLELQRETADFGQAFMEAQRQRYGRYLTALGVLRVVYRDDPGALRALTPFKRRRRRPNAAAGSGGADGGGQAAA